MRGGIEGAVQYLAKPVAPDALVDAVADALAGDPEPVQRKAAQQHGPRAPGPDRDAAGRLRQPARLALGSSGLERPRPRADASTSPLTARTPDAALTDKQRALLRALQPPPR